MQNEPDTTNDSATLPAESPTDASGTSIQFRNPKKSKPTQTLPSDRVTVEKQLEVLRGFVAASDAEGRPVTNDEAGKVVGMAGATTVVTNPFFTDTGLLIRMDGGAFSVGQAARDYQAAYQWDMVKAGRKLAPAFADKWFSKVLIPRLKMRAFPRGEAVGFLAEAAKAGPEYRPRLEMIIDFLNAAGIVSADAGEVRLGALDAEENTDSRNGGGRLLPPPPPADPPPPKNEIPTDAPFIYLDSKRTKRVVIVSDATELTMPEWKRLKAWFELQFFKPDESDEPGT